MITSKLKKIDNMKKKKNETKNPRKSTLSTSKNSEKSSAKPGMKCSSTHEVQEAGWVYLWGARSAGGACSAEVSRNASGSSGVPPRFLISLFIKLHISYRKVRASSWPLDPGLTPTSAKRFFHSGLVIRCRDFLEMC